MFFCKSNWKFTFLLDSHSPLQKLDLQGSFWQVGKSTLNSLQLSEAMRDVNSMKGRDVRIHHPPFVELETDMDVSEK